jgi:hypothetical protein
MTIIGIDPGTTNGVAIVRLTPIPDEPGCPDKLDITRHQLSVIDTVSLLYRHPLKLVTSIDELFVVEDFEIAGRSLRADPQGMKDALTVVYFAQALRILGRRNVFITRPVNKGLISDMTLRALGVEPSSATSERHSLDALRHVITYCTHIGTDTEATAIGRHIDQQVRNALHK